MDLILQTNSQGRVWVKNDGKVGIGTSAPTATLHVIGDIFATGGVSSSVTLKQDISLLSTNDALNTLRQLSPVTCRYRADQQGDLQLGFIAEDVPEIVSVPGRTGVQPMDFIAILTKVVQQQQERIEALEERLEQLEP